METKTFTAPLELKKDGKPGEFKAVFATFDVPDLHKDWTISGAFRDGQETVIEQWNHGYELPAGKGVIVSDDKEAWIDGAFFLDTEVGNETYKTVKNLGGVAEWSYTFDIIDAVPIDPKEYDGADRMLKELDVVGVAPVTRGAGINTRTTAIKSKEESMGQTDSSDPDESSAQGGADGQGGNASPNADLDARINLAEIQTIITRNGVES